MASERTERSAVENSAEFMDYLAQPHHLVDGFAQAIDRARLDTLFDTLSASNLAIATAIG